MILDTCALLWLAIDQRMLSESALGMIAESSVVGVSAISAFEIGQKHKRGQLELSLPPKQWFQRAIARHNLTVVDLSAEICLRATELPEIHKDPFDRLIIATAMSTGRPVLTGDSVFDQYGIETIA
jgi:PIN domain nuclease of toxin-antitoxin system